MGDHRQELHDVIDRTAGARLRQPANRPAASLEAGARGNLVFDAQIVALCREHGISTILNNDRDFRRFETPRVRLLGEMA